MKSYTSLALFVIAALSGFVAFQAEAAEQTKSTVESAEIKPQAVQSKEDSIIWIKNGSKQDAKKKTNLTVTFTTSSGGRAALTRTILPAQKLKIGKAKDTTGIKYAGTTPNTSVEDKTYTLDFQKDLKEGSDIVFIIKPAQTIEEYDAEIVRAMTAGTPKTAQWKWQVAEVKELKPGEDPN